MLKRTMLAMGLAGALLAQPAQAGEAGDILRDALYGGTVTAGAEQLAPLAAAGDPEAEFGIGFLRFFTGVQNLTHALYRYGLVAPDTSELGPILSFPIAANPNPELLDYEKVRGILKTLLADMDSAREAMAIAGAHGDYVISLDPLKFRLDVDGDGKAGAEETVAAFIANFGGDFQQPAPSDGTGTDKNPPVQIDATIGFDRADALWIAGYSQVFAAHAEFFLAHDFSDLVNSSFHRIFPRAGLPMQGRENAAGGLFLGPSSDAFFADAIAAVHSLNMKVIDPAGLKRVLTRLKSITALSRENWQAILAETDDNRELVPSPRQTSIAPDGVVTDDSVKAWMATLDTADEILDGKLLVPHWRFAQGFDLKAYFEGAKRTDIVMLLSGYDALPFLRDGPIADATSFAEANRVFGDNILGYAFWFN